MTSVMSTGSGSSVELPPSDQGNGTVGEDLAGGSTGPAGSESAGRVELNVVGAGEKVAPASLAGDDGSNGTRVCENVDVLKLENEGNTCGGENQVSSSVSRMHVITKSTDLGNEKQESKTVMLDRSSILSDYNSFLSAFDEFAAKSKDEAVGHGYYIGDMVWGKVKSHPWWPGQIYNEALASPSVRRSKHEGQVLVAFFGDNSYGWFDPAELIPFEENFEKSRQTTSRGFLSAVEEAIDEVSRRKSLGLACRCRSEFNFRPSNVEGYFVVDVGNCETGVYGWNQINKAQDSFQPREMFLFVEQLALQPMNHQFWAIDFIKNKATVLACRRARFQEYDETYAQAFGINAVCPLRPSVPVAVDPVKAPLSGRLVTAEALGQGRISVKPTKTEKDKYLFKRRDEPMQMKSNKAIFSQAGPTPHLLLFDVSGFSDKVIHSSTTDQMHQASEFTITYSQHQLKTHQMSMTSNIKHSEGFSRVVEGGKKKIKVQKRPAGALNAENAALVEREKKKKKEMKTETIGNFRQLPLAISHSGTKTENVSGTPFHVTHINTKLDNQKSDAVVDSFPSRSQQEMDFGKLELQMMVTDLRALALNPCHGMERSCPVVIQQVFLKYRSLVYQKSLVLSPRAEHEVSERNSNKSLAPTFSGLVSVSPPERIIDKKIAKAVTRLDDPTKGGKKRGPFDRPEDVKKKKLDVPEEIKKKKKIGDSVDTKKKIDDTRLLAAERKTFPRPIVTQRVDTKENAAKIASAALTKTIKLEPGSRMESGAKKPPATQPKAVKLQSSSKMEPALRVPIPTMLVMKFPAGAALPSSAELRAKFARFGQMDHSATRVFWKTYTCRLVFLYKIDAEAALKFALGSSNLFGNTHVICYIKERESVEAVEPEPRKILKEEIPVNAAQSQDIAIEQTAGLRSAAQLKSCLKKPCVDQGGIGNGRSTRVKFVLGRDESLNGAEPSINENTNRIASLLPKGTPEKSSKISPSSWAQPLPPTEPRPRARTSNSAAGQPMPGGAVMDISQQMINLLLKCNDVVSNLRSMLGYMPYQPL